MKKLDKIKNQIEGYFENIILKSEVYVQSR